MNDAEYFDVFDLESSGKTEEGFLLLERLAEEGNYLALLDLSARYFSTEGYAFPVKAILSDEKKSEELALKAEKRLLELATAGDGEAMRMLANTYLGHWHPVLKKSVELAETWLLRAYEVEHYEAANDLAVFYLERDIDRAKFYYREAELHSCKVIYHDRLET